MTTQRRPRSLSLLACLASSLSLVSCNDIGDDLVIRDGGTGGVDSGASSAEQGSVAQPGSPHRTIPACETDDEACCPDDGTSVVLGTSGNDNLSGGSSSQCLVGLAGDDQLEAGSAGDYLICGPGVDQCDGDSGPDVIHGGPDRDVVDAGSANDLVDAGEGDNEVDLGSGNDECVAGGGADEIDGESGHDVVHAGAGDDVVKGGGGNDELHGGFGDDHLQGESGSDTLIGGPGLDRVEGGSGNDTVIIHELCEIVAGEVYDGGSGTDTLIAPADVATLETEFGVVVDSFENVQLEARPYDSECGTCDCQHGYCEFSAEGGVSCDCEDGWTGDLCTECTGTDGACPDARLRVELVEKGLALLFDPDDRFMILQNGTYFPGLEVRTPWLLRVDEVLDGDVTTDGDDQVVVTTPGGHVTFWNCEGDNIGSCTGTGQPATCYPLGTGNACPEGTVVAQPGQLPGDGEVGCQPRCGPGCIPLAGEDHCDPGGGSDTMALTITLIPAAGFDGFEFDEFLPEVDVGFFPPPQAGHEFSTPFLSLAETELPILNPPPTLTVCDEYYAPMLGYNTPNAALAAGDFRGKWTFTRPLPDGSIQWEMFSGEAPLMIFEPSFNAFDPQGGMIPVVRAGLRAWGAHSSSSLASPTVFEGVCALNPNDNLSCVMMGDTEAWGETRVVTSPRGVWTNAEVENSMVSADMIFNHDVKWRLPGAAGYDVGPGIKRPRNLSTIAKHEGGHLMGLRDLPNNWCYRRDIMTKGYEVGLVGPDSAALDSYSRKRLGIIYPPPGFQNSTPRRDWRCSEIVRPSGRPDECTPL